MLDPAQYQLIDFGDGRKLERFGAYVLDRPSPAAEGKRKTVPARWGQMTARFERTDKQSGVWSPPGALPPRWSIQHAGWQLELKATEFGQVGVFAEQAENWDWVARQVGSRDELTVLNLFAYTGAATLAAAAAGARVTHVDAARNVVHWARRNAQRSGLSAAPIRWICDDAVRFVQRELRRGRQYDAIILDPPTYGHGPQGQAWKLAKHLAALLRDCAELTRRQPALVLLTCHCPGYGPAELASMLTESFGRSCQQSAQGKRLVLRDLQGRALDSGAMARLSSVAS
jgi:23S rRNA (cytosine1962-C5)-methyltransferase